MWQDTRPWMTQHYYPLTRIESLAKHNARVYYAILKTKSIKILQLDYNLIICLINLLFLYPYYHSLKIGIYVGNSIFTLLLGTL